MSRGFTEQRMPDFVKRVGDFSLRVTDSEGVIESLIDRDVDILVNGHADYGPWLPRVETREIGPSAHEAYAEWRSRDEHSSTVVNS